jgi:mono/diheme cytochrome c family protein
MKIAITAVLLALMAHASQAAPADEQALKATGKQVFDQWCAGCHAAGPRMPGTASLAAKYGDSLPAALEERDNLNPAIVRHFVRNGVLVMPPFRKTEITDAELDALGAYLTRAPQR